MYRDESIIKKHLTSKSLCYPNLIKTKSNYFWQDDILQCSECDSSYSAPGGTLSQNCEKCNAPQITYNCFGPSTDGRISVVAYEKHCINPACRDVSRREVRYPDRDIALLYM